MNAEYSTKRKGVMWVIGIILLLLLTFVVGRMTARYDAPDDDVAAHDHAERTADEAEVWTCSMHPQVRQPEPGSCPICGMDLIPVANDDEDEARDDNGEVRLRVSEHAAALMDIQTWPAERRAVSVDLRFFGRVDVDETRLVDVVARSPGYIERLHAHFSFQQVKKGDVLAELYSPDVVAAMRELLVARERGGQTLDAAKSRLVRMGVLSDQIDEVIASGEVPRTYRVNSPMNGVVMVVGEREGQWLREGGRIVQLADLSMVWVQMEAYETELAWVSEGQSIHFETQAYPGETFQGEVVYVNPVLNSETRTVRFRTEVSNPDGRLKPGLFVRGTLNATATIGSGHGEHAIDHTAPLVVPASAPLITGKRALVYVKDRDADRPTFEPREVVLGPRAGDYYVIREGLREGDLVVMNGQFKIDSELQIRGRPSLMAPESGPPPGQDNGTMEHEHAVEQAESGVAGFRLGAGKGDDAVALQIAELLEPYWALSDALAHDDPNAARHHARNLHKRLLEVDSEPLPDDARAMWRELEGDLLAALHRMTEEDALDGLRKPFESLSKAITAAVKWFAKDTISDAYVMTCPMAFDGEGADWLQRDDDVRNPYFGASMYRCGAVQRKL